MSKKTFNIADLFNYPNLVEKSLKQVLADIVVEQELDQQDIIDILETAAKNHSNHVAYYMGLVSNFPHNPNRIQYPQTMDHRRPPFDLAGYGYQNQAGFDGQKTTFAGDECPEFFEKLFEVAEFEIRYGNTLLTKNFKFVGIEVGKGLTYLGRDKELLTVEGAVSYSRSFIQAHLNVSRSLTNIRIGINYESREALDKMILNGEIVTPGNKPFSTDTRNLIQHLRQQQWLHVSEGDLVTVLDRPEVPESVFMVGRIDREGELRGGVAEAVVIPVQILMNNKEVTAKPLGGGIQKVDLMLLKPWNPKD